MQALSTSRLANIAQKIQFVSFDVIQYRDNEMKSHWFKNDHVDLYYFQKSNGDLAKFHMTLFGQVLEWNPYDGVQTGVLVEEERDGEVFELIHFDSRPNSNSISQSVLILENAGNIDLSLRQRLIANIGGKVKPLRSSVAAQLKSFFGF